MEKNSYLDKVQINALQQRLVSDPDFAERVQELANEMDQEIRDENEREIRKKDVEIQKQNRRLIMRGWLDEAGIAPGYTVVEAPVNRGDGIFRRETIYLNFGGREVTDRILSEDAKFSKQEFLDKVKTALNITSVANNVSGSVVELMSSKVPISIDSDGLMVLNAMGCRLTGHTLFTETEQGALEIDLYNGGENKEVLFRSKGQNKIDVVLIEYGGGNVVYTISNGIFKLDSKRVISDEKLERVYR